MLLGAVAAGIMIGSQYVCSTRKSCSALSSLWAPNFVLGQLPLIMDPRDSSDVLLLFERVLTSAALIACSCNVVKRAHAPLQSGLRCLVSEHHVLRQKICLKSGDCLFSF